METLKTWCSNFLQWAIPQNLETLEEEEEQQSDDQMKTFPNEIIEDILSRLPVKSILRFRSVSKPWLSIISDPSFATLQLTRATTFAIFVTAYDPSTCKEFYLSATHGGGSITVLMTTNRPYYKYHDTNTEAEHLNGLVCSTSWYGFANHDEPFVINPSTRNVFKVRDPAAGVEDVGYFFGFDESRNEHKILRMVGINEGSITTIRKIMIYSMSNYSWREVYVTVDSGGSNPYIVRGSVCVNSVIHIMFEILAFDLRTEKFSIVKVPLDDDDLAFGTRHSRNGRNEFTNYEHPYLIKIKGCVGVVCYDCMVEANEIDIWILQDLGNHVWVKETIAFPEAWCAADYCFPLDSINMDEIIFSLRKVASNVIMIPIYNMKTESFKSAQFTLDHPFLRQPTIKFDQIKCYVESMVPLPRD